MNVVHLSASLSRAAGGIFEIELALATQLKLMGVGTRALGLHDKGWSKDSDRWDSVNAEVCPIIGPSSFGYSRHLAPKLESSPADLGHLHSLWMYPSIAIHQWSKRAGIPYVVTPNGMLEPWALKHSAWKKKLAGVAYENRMLRGAVCLQVNTAKELADCRSYGLKTPAAIIPNGIHLPNDSITTTPSENGVKTLLFLGRLHPKKGLANALRAWAKRPKSTHWQFIIAGWEQEGHQNELKQLCQDLEINEATLPLSDFLENPDQAEAASIVFVGSAFGDQKDQLLRHSDAFILPSVSEGMPMSILEAWAYGLPVVMTDHCNLPEGFAAEAAISITTEPDSISAGLRTLFEASPDDLNTMGANGRALVERQFTWPHIATQMKAVYDWVLGGGPAPDCVKVD